jgi:hypothetical protein
MGLTYSGPPPPWPGMLMKLLLTEQQPRGAF